MLGALFEHNVLTIRSLEESKDDDESKFIKILPIYDSKKRQFTLFKIPLLPKTLSENYFPYVI